MKAEISDLGPVRCAEIDLRPLTIFIGPNNAGKTWVAYTLYGILGPSGLEKFVEECLEETDRHPTLDDLAKQVLDKGNASIDLGEWAQEYMEAYLNQVAEAFTQHWINDFMNAKDIAHFAGTKVRFSLSADDRSESLNRISGRQVEARFSVGRKRQALLRAEKSQGDPVLYFYTETPKRLTEELPGKVIRRFVIRNVLDVVHSSFWSDAVSFPVERTAFNTLLQAVQETGTPAVKERPSRLDRQSRSPFPQPVDDYLRWMILLCLNASEDIELPGYRQFSKILECELLDGNIRFSAPTPEPAREILFHFNEHPLELSLASSMVRELSSLLLYLRHGAEKGDLLMIDEPEMNLHPWAQVQLTELLSILANQGLNFLITTHSPYITDHLNNLMRAAACPDAASIQGKFSLKNADAFIPISKVSVYLFDPRDGIVKNALSGGMIDWATFGEVSDWVSQLYHDLC
jgi:hypothetical protein